MTLQQLLGLEMAWLSGKYFTISCHCKHKKRQTTISHPTSLVGNNCLLYSSKQFLITFLKFPFCLEYTIVISTLLTWHTNLCLHEPLLNGNIIDNQCQ